MRRALSALVAGALCVGLAACSGKTAGGDDTSSGDGNGAITVSTDSGDVSLDKPAVKVVALEWVFAEDLVSMGVTPVGVADKAGYNEWVTGTDPLGDDVTDVGTRQEPSVEQIKALQPDLIVTDAYRGDIAVDELSDVATVATFNSVQPDRSQWDTMNFITEQLGVATGKQDEAAAVLDDLDSTITQAGQTLDDAGLVDAPFALCQAFTTDGTPQLRLLGTTALSAVVLDKVGLHNTWDGDLDEWGMTTVGVESLTALPDDTYFLYAANAADDPISGALADNDVWKDLGFVSGDRVSAIDGGTWFFGGPASAAKVVDEAVKALTA